MKRSHRSKVPVVSPQGSRDTRFVGVLRLSSALATLGAIAGIGRIFDSGPTKSSLAVTGVFAVLAGVLATVELAYGGRAARAEERRIRDEILTRQYAAASAPRSERDEYPPGRVIQMMTDSAERVTEFRQVYFGSTMAAMLIPVAVLVWIGIFIDAVVGFVVLALIPVIPLAIGGFMRVFRKTSANSREQRAALTVRYLDAIRNLVTIRLLGAGDRITEELRIEGEKNRGTIMKLLAGNQVVIVVMDGIFSLVLICTTIWLTAVRGDHLSNGDVLIIALSILLLLEPLQQVAGFFYIGMGGMASQKEIRGFYEHTGDLDTLDLTTEPSPSPDVDRNGPAIELSNVQFDYGRGPVLAGVDLSVPTGARIAIMGPSGEGKSTLLGLLRGSIPKQEGRIVIDGRDLAHLTSQQVRSLSATVSQSTWMFTGTIADNLRLARGNATDEEMWRVLRLANVADEIERMPDGIQTDMGESATLISGGQAQRISLARALLSGRRILLLDEPTSQVDVESEARIIEALDALPRDWTLLMVTHRSSLVRIADTVYALRAGSLSPVKEPTRV